MPRTAKKPIPVSLLNVTSEFLTAVQPNQKAVIEVVIVVQLTFSERGWFQSTDNCNTDYGYHDCEGRAAIDDLVTCSDGIVLCNCPARAAVHDIIVVR